MKPAKALEVLTLLMGGQAKLAEQLGLHPAAITHWHRRGIPRKHVPALVKLCDHQLDYDDFRPDIDWSSMKEFDNESGNNRIARTQETAQGH